MDPSTDSPPDRNPFQFSTADLLVMMGVVAVGVAWSQGLVSSGVIRRSWIEVVFVLNLTWFVLILRVILKENDTRGLLFMVIAGVLLLFLVIPYGWVGLCIITNALGDSNVLISLGLLYAAVCLCGSGASLALGMLYLARRRLTLGVICLLIGLFSILVYVSH